ncbi:prolow-density lipoprotein receptor-related protein 1 isoform X2 [Nothobranchius furzeri]|uniref:prolow-density lipoprotein receptor-related protein 1 isoform X2 n=1 Tax=Nothobranchius furzeri TaxID=105023 RepID=UPI003904B81E
MLVRVSRARADMHLRTFICLLFLATRRFSSGQIIGCPRGQWQCDDGHCITDAWRCDGQGDCLDGSDEMDCEASGGFGCPPGQFACEDSVGCVDVSARCDGRSQCPTGSDEENCLATEGCLDSEWMCRNHVCIPTELRCNRKNDCLDNSDEQDCGTCSAEGVRCPDGTCLSPEERCDGQIHCSDGSDEPITCGRICSMNNGGCSHVCTDEVWGARCSCPVGLKLSPNGAVCEDLDECASPFPPCVHHCANTVGSFYCHCRVGFKLVGSSKCRASGNATRLLTVQKNAVGLLNVKSQHFNIIKASVFDPVALAYDITRGYYYWADRGGNIFKSNGQQSWTTFSGEPGIKGLACDWLNGYLFWTNQKTRSIYMQSADGASYTTLLNKNISPSDLVVLPVESSMFWINVGPGDRVTLEKSWMDGSDRGTLAVLTAQVAHSLTADVAARRLYWISGFKRSIETVKVDGTGRFSFTGMFNRRPARSLAVFESVFYWVDDKGLWQVPQSQPSQRKFIWRTELPQLVVYHELQQPKGSSVCAEMSCDLCQLTKSNSVGFTCACPYFKVLLPDGMCEFPRFLYTTITTINLLEFRGSESSETQLFTTDEGILSFDVDWYRDWLYWANQTGHIQRSSLTQDKVELIPAPLPVCLINVDQRNGNLFWVSCDQNSIGTITAGSNYPQQLYRTTKEIRSLYLDWLRGGMFWLEDKRIFSMDLAEGKAKELLEMTGGVGNLAFDLRASSLLWNSKRAGLTTLSLLKERSHQAGRRWNISGSVVAAFEPFLLSYSNEVITLWDLRDGTKIASVTVRGYVLNVIVALGDIQIEPETPECNAPSLLCRRSSICILQTQFCDGKRDCPDGDDEDFCVVTCSSKDEFKCKDSRSCIPIRLVCDGRSHCHDGSDEASCPTEAAPLTRSNHLKCRSGSKLCADGTECVLYSHVCDGEMDCQDGSDEVGCDEPKENVDKSGGTSPTTPPPAATLPACLSPSVLCPSAHICISPDKFCNGIKDCPDGFDEKNCIKSCPLKNDFLCKDRLSCLSKSLVCDGRSHCSDGSDEVNCPNLVPNAPRRNTKCPFGSKLCRDGIGCVLLGHLCDGQRDCPDGSDEECGQNLSKAEEILTTIPPTTPPCTSPSVLCPGSSVCIKQTQMCDRKRDCPDGFDEKCIKRCPSATDFRCKDRRSCVPRSQVCDGRSHCHDGSDEFNCQSPAAPETPTKILKCRFGSKSCRDGTGCVLLSHVCDGERDCPDGSDEEGCDDAAVEPAISGENQSSTKAPALTEKLPEPPTTPPCTSPSVLCPGSSVCIKQTQMCDGKRDCPDGFDEKCIKRCPSATDFRCKDRRSCVQRSQVCDGRSHCHDGSDEFNCQSPAAPETPTKILKCRFGSKSCRDGTGCVLLSHVCDGERDCPDGSDEEGCDDADDEPAISGENQSLTKAPALTEKLPEPPTTPPCTSPSVLCPGSSVCIKQTQMCDGKRDCPDGFDEKCIKRCPSATDFRCKDRRSCVQKSHVCDGRSHCHDGSDELNCRSPAAPETPTKVLKCRFGSKSCRDGTGCVLLSHVCDGERDCPDGSDEEECDDAVRSSENTVETKDINESPTLTERLPEPPTTLPCTSPSVLCPGSSVCIKQTQMCDGKRDCPDGFDEKCIKRCPSATDFRCKDRRSCVQKSQVCDGRSHCHDGSDEFNCQSPAAPETPTKILKCRFGSKSCRDGTGCVLLSHVCDGERDCPDGSDEEECAEGVSTSSVDKGYLNESLASLKLFTEPPTTPPCTSPSVLCPGTSICIKQTQMCDKRRDCPDGFDEKCVKRCPSAAHFRCKDRRSCVPRSQVCDGRSHCHDGSDELNCRSPAAPETPTKILKCRFGSKSCRDGTGCVLLSHVCDGERDCPDGSDEEECDDAVRSSDNTVETKDINESPTLTERLPEPPTTPPCTSPSVLCPGSSVCIKQTQMCDRKRDCPDGFDEKCVKRCPSATDFRCKDRRSCVPRRHVCDGRSHCHDGSDEADCPNVALPAARNNVLKCRTGAKPCRDGTECVLFSHVCDGERDCQDGSDEDDCETTESPALTSSPCSFPSVQCPSSTVCIDPSQLCDGVRNCPDGSDEICVKRCADKTDFLCKDRRSCVSRTLVCDGRSHCSDASDEANCARVTPPPSRSVLKCRMGSKPCDDGKECVLFSHVCDGEMDCLDGSDERGCQETCEGEFQCAHGKKCIPEAEVCDGKFQCQDQSDEQHCWEKTKSCEHRCADGKRCIPKKFLCDGEQDCLDGSDEVGCDLSPATTEFPLLTSPPACITPSVLCPGSFKCISQYQLCDGQRDCPDGFDEKDCVVRCENPDDFLCSDQRKCIPQTQVCDGRAQCPDGSDEKRCQSEDLSATSNKAPSTRPVPLKCRTGFKPCKNGLECIMYSHVCDGEMDCQDGSDEEGCESLCKAGEFLCSHGRKCIPQEQVCDGRSDCQDRSDELDCSIRSEGCSRRCDNNTRCLPQTFLCDGERDCADASDEENCGVVACAAQQYRCASGQCVSEALRCDGYPDCRDRSDEMDCARPPRCPVELRCPHSHECLQKEWLCDGEEDCKDGSDEKNCNNPPAKCRKHQFQCGDGSQCIPLSWRCDGKEDCSNRMDEDKCSQRKCPFHLYQCGSRECLDPKLVCNGFTNCADGSDEGVGCAQRNCSSPSAPLCDFRCVSTPNGPRCYCGAGFRLQSSSRSCMDIDECSSSGALCKHICQNTPGSYSCLCHPGFYLEPDNRSCKTKDEPLLLASVQTELLILGVHSGKMEILSSVDRPVFSLDYDLLQQRVYWLSPDYQSVRWAGMRSSNKGTLIKGVKSNSLAVDWVGRNLYWVDGLVGQILAAKLINSTMRSQDYTVVLGDNLEQPSSLVLLPERGLMLWSEIGSSPQIERAGMDGSQRKVVVSRDLSWPVGLAFDFLDNRLFWADEKLRCIGSASLDGDDIQILQLAETPSPFSVAVFNDRVFWSDTKRRTVRSADKKTGKDQKVLLKRPGQPFGLKLMHALSQPAASSPCELIRCSHLCLLAPPVPGQSGPAGSPAAPVTNAAVCRCPKGLLLAEDRMTCSLPKESAFILLLFRDSVHQIYLRSMRRDGSALKKMPNGRDFALPGVKEALALDLFIPQLLLFVAYSNHGSVDVMRLSSSKSNPKLVAAEPILKLEDSVTALAVDWVTANVYWSSVEKPDIHVTSHFGGHTTSLLHGSLIAVSSIALHPSTGRLCYIAVAMTGAKGEAGVDCAWMDGRNTVVLWRKSSIPISLVFSDAGTRIYWADSGEGVISSIGVDGSGYREYKTGPNLLVSFTRIENLFLWVTRDKDVSKLWFSDGRQPKQVWFETKNAVVELRSYNNDTQAGSNSCSSNNGGCDHLCLPYPGGRTCKCGRGFYIISDTSCTPLPSCPLGEESCSDGSKCVSSSQLCDGRVDCPNGSDEENCVISDSTSSDTKEHDNSSLPLQPNPQKNSVSSDDLESCDLERCSGHGNCIIEGQSIHCRCLPAYKGESCQELNRQSHPAVIMVAFCLVSAVVLAGFVFTKRKGWECFRRSSEKDPLMAHMALPEQDSDTEESPVDVRNPLQTDT